MAEFQDVMKQKKRMCNSTLCCKCDIYYLCEKDLSRCQLFISNNPQKAEEIIMRWAAEHPEPIYPTLYEWLETLIDDEHTRLIVDDHDFVEWLAITRIPVDIAQKLGLKPKEG